MSKSDELRATFFQESEELLEQLADGLSEMDAGTANSETINAVFRAVHSIKGGAGAFALDEVVRFAHHYESVLGALRDDKLDREPQVHDILTRAADCLANLVEAAGDGSTPNVASSDQLISELSALTGEGKAKPEAETNFAPMSIDLGELGSTGPAEMEYSVRFAPHAELFANGNEAGFLLRDLCALGEATVRCDTAGLPQFVDVEPSRTYLAWDIELKTTASEQRIQEVFEFVDGVCDLTIKLAEVASGENAEAPGIMAAIELDSELPPTSQERSVDKPAAKTATQPAASTIRVELHRIDRMINLVGELVIHQAMLTQCLKTEDNPPGREVDLGLEELRTLTRQIQDSVMAIRAQPVKALFQRMSRLAREAGADVGKDLQVETEGAGTEIDKTVIEKLADPLTHMIRNAVDHGLEGAERRRATGKDPIGTIRLSAAHSAGRVVIEISDDGAGIDRNRVREIAEEKGLVTADARLTAEEIDNLIFLPGFSTASELSNLSGRGVGMDVVKSSIKSLGGRVSIASRPGEGSTFSIVLPLTLAVLDGMVVEVAEQTIVVPISSIIETMRLRAEDTFKLGTDNAVVRIRGYYIPIVDVGAVLGFRPPVESTDERVILLIETADDVRAALMIDAIQDQRQVVIKGLEENYGQAHGVAAATILGNGRIAFILDASAVVGSASGNPPTAICTIAAE